MISCRMILWPSRSHRRWQEKNNIRVAATMETNLYTSFVHQTGSTSHFNTLHIEPMVSLVPLGEIFIKIVTV